MGYYTRYSLETGMDDNSAIVEALRKFDVIGWDLDENLQTNQAGKWYGHESDMKQVSTQFPDVHFVLSGEGEENGDIWEKHFVNGKMQVCKAVITIPEFNPNLLK